MNRIHPYKFPKLVNYKATWVNTSQRQHSAKMSGTLEPIKMSYTTFDTAKSTVPPVLIYHGLFGSKSNWNTMSKSINEATKRTVYTVDGRNHGDSPHTEEHTYFHLAEDIKLFLNDVKTKRVALIGHSMGGRACMVFAIKYPDMVESLVSVDIAPYGGSNLMLDSWKQMFRDLKDMNFKKGLTFSEMRSFVEKTLRQKNYGRTTASFLSMNIKEIIQGKFKWKFNVDSLMRNFHPHITLFPENLTSKKYDGPTLFVVGGDSDYVSMSEKDKIVQIFPKAQFTVIPDCGHWPHYEKPKEFLQSVTEFLNKNPSK